jgi:hypothetical protein
MIAPIDLVKMQIEMIAKELAWHDLLPQEQKMYQREAQKQISQEQPWIVEEGLLEVKPKIKKMRKR